MPGPPSESSAKRYRAFISYSHADEKWASWLHRGLETYTVPRALVGTHGQWGALPARLYPIFRDREELASAADLPGRIEEALRASEALIVICSPAAAASRWVGEEVRRFVALHGHERVYCLVVAGEPGSGGAQECFPESIRFRIGPEGELTDEPVEPLAADARPQRDGRDGAILKLLAGLLGTDYDRLRQRDQKRRRTRSRVWAVAAVALIAVLAGAAWYATLRRIEAEQAQAAELKARELAEQQRDLANERQQIALARQLAAQADRMRIEQPAELELASLLAIESVRRLQTLETQQALLGVHRLLPAPPRRLGDGSSMTDAVYSRDGGWLAIQTPERILVFRGGGAARTWETPIRHDADWTLTPDGCCLLSAENGVWRIRALADGRDIPDPPAYFAALQSSRVTQGGVLQFSPDGAWLAVGGKVLHVPDGRMLGLAPQMRWSTFSGDGRSIAQSDGHRVAVFGTDASPRASLAFEQESRPNLSPDGSLLLGLGNDQVEMYELASGVRLYRKRCESPYTDAAFSPDGQHLVLACRNEAQVLDARSGTRTTSLAHGRPVNRVRYSADGRLILTASYDRTSRVFEVERMREVWRATHEGYVVDSQLAPDGRNVLTAGISGYLLWPLNTEPDVLAKLPREAAELAASPDGRWVAAATFEPEAELFVIGRSDGRVRSIARGDDRPLALDFSPDSRRLLMADRRSLRIWDVDGPQHWQWALPDYPYANILATRFATEGEVLIAHGGRSLRSYISLERCALGEGTVDLNGCRARREALPPFHEPNAFFSMDGTELVWSGDGDQPSQLHSWPARDSAGDQRSLPAVRVNDLVVTADRVIAAHTSGGLIEQFGTARQHALRIEHEGYVQRLALAPDRLNLAGALGDPVSVNKNRVVIWSLDKGREVARFARPGHEGPIAFSPDGKRLLYSDGVRIRSVMWQSESLAASVCARLTRNLRCGEWHAWLGDEPYRPTCKALASGCQVAQADNQSTTR